MVKKKNRKAIGIVGIILAIALVFFVTSGQFFASTYTGDEEIKFAIPHMASYRCEPVQDKYGISITIPDGGALISKETVGFNTNGISNIKIISNGRWKKTRLRYFVCDSNGLNCGGERILDTQTAGTYSISVSSLNFDTQSLKLYSEEIGTIQVWNWYYWDGNRVTFDGKVFGLRLYSTTRDPAGAKICTTSCNLDCPDIGYREKLLLTSETKLGFYETAPYLEYWETIDYDLNKQGGATIYNERTNKFCFAGSVYTGAKLKMDNGVTYLYPNTNTRENKLCCPGATISATHSDMICQEDYTWKIIGADDELTCISDFNCPKQGDATCQDRKLSGYHCKNKDENNVGVCVKDIGTSVECCVNGDCSIDQVCDIATYTCKGGTTLPVCGDGKLDAGEQCDDGNTISGDGCTTTCETEVEYCVSHPEDPICGLGKCQDCDAYALSTLTFGYYKSCKPKLLQNTVFCIFSFIKLILVPIVFLISLLVSASFFMSFKALGRNKLVAWLLGFLVAGLLALAVYMLFFVGVIITIIGLIIFKFAKPKISFRDATVGTLRKIPREFRRYRQ